MNWVEGSEAMTWHAWNIAMCAITWMDIICCNGWYHRCPAFPLVQHMAAQEPAFILVWLIMISSTDFAAWMSLSSVILNVGHFAQI
jgi:hypothetical protein